MTMITAECLAEQDATGAWRSVVAVSVDGAVRERVRSLPIFASQAAALEVARRQKPVVVARWYRQMGVFVEFAGESAR